MDANSPLAERISFSRTLPPTLPKNYLSRKHLFPLLENSAPGSTIITAPAGYGKSSLVAEWSSQHTAKVIWLTLVDSDPIAEMSSLFIQATRNVIPGFGAWFEELHPMRPTDVVKRWGNELLALGGEYILVIDNIRDNSSLDVNVASKLIEQFPGNVFLVVIRRDLTDELFDTCIARGNTKVVGTDDLRFSTEEMEQLAKSINADFKNAELQQSLKNLNGWPSAVSLAINHFANNPQSKNLADQLIKKGGPLHVLAELAFRNLDKDTQDILVKLSLVEEFTHDMAQVILGDSYSFEKVSDIASHGEIFTRTNDPHISFRFSPLMRDIAYSLLKEDRKLKQSLDTSIAVYYESIHKYDLAMDHYFACGNQERVSALFRNACRVKQARAQGDDLIRWSEYAGKSPVDGSFKRASVLISGYISNLNFESARVEIDKIRLTLDLAQDRNFADEFIAAAECFIYLTQGNFNKLIESARVAFPSNRQSTQAPEEKIMALRLLAFKHLSLDEYSEMEALVQAAENESSRTFNDFSHAYLGAIKAMSLLMKAEFNQAYEMATLSVHNFQRLGIVGLFGPVDLYYVQARCLLEFGQREEAQALFEKTASIAKSWKHWPIYFFSRGTYIRDLALKKHFDLAFEEIKRDRELIESFYFENHLNSIVDLSEMFVRYHSKKWDRFDSLIESALDTRLSRQISNLYNLETHKKSFDSISETLEVPTPLDEIYKHLFNAGKVIDIESEAIVEMEKALRIGARIGSRETFLRQGPELGGLILKIAVHNPTLYIENLARDMAERIREREEMSTQHGELLTKRELEILRQLSTGRTLTVIAGELHISKNTMKTHLKNLYKKLEADGRDDAVAKGKARSII